MQEIPLVHLSRQHDELQEQLTDAFVRVLGASSFVLGEEVDRFEQEFAAYCDVRFCVGVASGTAALTIALLAAGIGPGDEVIVPAHTFIASALGVVHAGAAPVLCDVDEGTGLIDLESAASAISDRTAAVLPVHLYGQACDMAALERFAERHGLAVVEDAAQAHGASHGGRRVGSSGTAAVFSFYPSKNLGGLGDAGAICTNDPALADRARALRHLGQRRKGEHSLLGFNERLDGLQAAFLRVKLGQLDRGNAARRECASAYREGLDGRFPLLPERPHAESVYHLFPIRALDRDGLARRLNQVGIGTGVHYSPALDRQPSLVKHALNGSDCPAATAWASEELSLPMFAGLRSDEVERVAAACVEWATDA